MKPRINTITLAVNNLEKSVAFYRDGLGWSTKGIVGSEFHDKTTGADGTVAFFELENDLSLALYERENLAKDAGVPAGAPNAGEFSLIYITQSKDEVDSLLAKAKAAGATIPAKPHMRPWPFYSGYFQDPDGHLWEVGWSCEEQ